ncbi:MAG: sulfurtransferase TusA family protein [Streptosporangiaceae bacterium]
MSGAGRPADAGRPDLTVDALGERCPLPVITLARRITEVPVGHLIEVLADDAAAVSDIPAWCALKSHQFCGRSDLPGRPGWSFLVRREA